MSASFLPLPSQPDFTLTGTTPPQASLFMPARNRAGLVSSSLASALSQAGIVLDILILDDASQDGTAAVILQQLRSRRDHPHSVRFWQGDRRRGNNVTAALVARAGCDFCIAQHDDDISAPHRARKLWETHRQTGATVVSSAINLIGRNGRMTPRDESKFTIGFVPPHELVAEIRPNTIGAALGFDRQALAQFPQLDTDYLTFTHDSLTTYRGSLLGGFYYLSERLLNYRQHEGQWSNSQGDYQDRYTGRMSNLSAWLALNLTMEKDLDHLLAGNASPKGIDPTQIRTDLHTARRKFLGEFVAQREELIRRGQRPIWIDETRFEQFQRELSRARFWHRGPWHRVAIWLKALRNQFRSS